MELNAENVEFYDLEEDKEMSNEELEKLKDELLQSKKCGNEYFLKHEYDNAIQKYTETLSFCPANQFREIQANLYYNIAISLKYLDEDDKIVEKCTKAIELDEKYIKAYILRGKINEKTDKLDEALKDYKRVLELDPSNREASGKCSELGAMIEVKNQKLKTEALGKLKELGNLFLKPFGLSTENFNFTKNDNSDGYSVNFQK